MARAARNAARRAGQRIVNGPQVNPVTCRTDCPVQTTSATSTIGHAGANYVTWLQEARGLSEHTVRAYNCDVAALVRVLGANARVDQLRPTSLLSFFEQQRVDGISASSLRRRAAGLRGFCTYLEKQCMVTVNPWPTEGVAFQRTRRLPRAVPGGELARLLNHLMRTAEVDDGVAEDQPVQRPREATTLLGTALMLTTGLRVGELVTFRTSDLDLSSRTIQVMGKGRRERIVFLSDDWLTRLASAYLLTRAQLEVVHDRFLFNTPTAPLTTSTMRSRLAKAARDAGLRQHVTPHMLRHSAATQLIESGVNIRFVQRLLGHASLTTTEIYTHVSDQALRDAVVSAGVLTRSLGADN